MTKPLSQLSCLEINRMLASAQFLLRNNTWTQDLKSRVSVIRCTLYVQLIFKLQFRSAFIFLLSSERSDSVCWPTIYTCAVYVADLRLMN